MLGFFPVSQLVLGSGNFLTASNFVTPLAGMLFGPVVGVLSALVGDLIDVYAGYVSLGGFGYSVMAADAAVVATAGLAFSGRRKAALLLPAVMVAAYWLDPISVLFVGPVPVTWLHFVSIAALAPVLLLEKKGRLTRLNPAFVTVVTFAALMCGQVTGTLVGQHLAENVIGMSPSTWHGMVDAFFPLYPVERILFTAVGSLVSLPVLRAVSRSRRTGAAS